MRRAIGSLAAAGVLLAAASIARPAEAQTLDARRLGMGGVVTSDMAAARGANLAFRAVPKGRSHGSIPLPLGLIQFASDTPEFDPDSPDFNVFEIADLITNPPLTLSLSRPDPVSSDISIYIARDSLSIDLEDLRRIVPESSLQNGGVTHLPGVGFGFRNAFAQMVPVVHVQNELNLDDALRSVLRDAEPFTTRTRYGLADAGVAQGAISFQAGLAYRVYHKTAPGEGEEEDEGNEDPRRNGSTSLYLGAGPKYLYGVAFGDVRGFGGATTGDTLFGSGDPVAIDVAARTRHAIVGGDGGAGHGTGADVGVVLYHRNFEFGIGMNDLGSEIDWKVTERRHVYSDSLNEFTTTEVASDREFTSRIPVTTTINVAKRFGDTTVAADIVDGPISTSIHLGAEIWMGMLAVRAGTYRDANDQWQGALGGGIKFSRIGLDLAIATHQRYVEEKRAVEMAMSLTLY
ncbi:MAG TPA: hypothetical protein VFU59_10380 [Candidatus Eisenbacteria bacterium]|nr:hypothetical protein [Candidatus Eisenbacteria bacterium]